MSPGPGITPEEFEPKAKNKSTAPSGLALIESLYFGSGPKAAEDQLQHLLGPDQALRPFSLSEKRQPSLDTDIVAADEVSYQNFSPPLSWGAPHSLQLARFGPKRKERDEYSFHSGEEILIPVEGRLEYSFFWSPGGAAPEDTVLKPPAGEGSVLRINPQVPHRLRTAGEEAMAWLVLRHASDSPVALVMDQQADAFALRELSGASESFATDPPGSSSFRVPLRRRVTSADLRKPGTYGMIAWGLSEMVRDARQRTGRTTTDLANQIGIDPSSLSRLEEAKSNVSIEMLVKVCRSLRVGLAECIASGGWTHEWATIDHDRKATAEPLLAKPAGTHAVHPYLLQLPAQEEIMAPSLRGMGGSMDEDEVSSWIVLKGRVLLELPPEMGSKAAILDAGNVLHFREAGMVGVHALQDTTVLQIVFSHACGCRSSKKSSRAGA